MKRGAWGWLAFLVFSATWMGAAALWSTKACGPAPRPRSSKAAFASSSAHVRAPRSGATQSAPSLAPALLDTRDPEAELIVRKLAELIDSAQRAEELDEVSRLKIELLALGERAAAPLLALLESERTPSRRELLLDLLREVPGRAAEAFLIDEARSGAGAASRSIAMDALAERGSPESLRALADIATTDPDLPSRPLIDNVRLVEDTSTELPDEVDFTPRMKAIVTLGSSDDDRVVPILLRILQHEREESLRMQAAQFLAKWRGDASVLEALQRAAARDSSRYVRLAALHALHGWDSPSLKALLAAIAEHDPDAGVRLLARRFLDEHVDEH